MATLLDAPLVDETLHALPGWEGDQTEIAREVHLAPAVDELVRTQVARDAEAMGHGPRVETVGDGTRFVLSTPEVGGVSELDIAFAARISDILHRADAREAGVEAVRVGAPEIDSAPPPPDHEEDTMPLGGRIRRPI